MAEVDFSDFEASETWFETQTAEVRSIMASRAALRVAAHLGRYDGDGAERLALTSWRCTLTSTVRGLGRTVDVEWLTDAALSGNDPARYALSAALSAESAANSVQSAHFVASPPRFDALSPESATFSATAWDSARLDLDLNTQALWAGAETPSGIQDAHDAFLTKMRANPDWDFFRTWYAQMWDGTFTDWDLATEVAKIGDEVWDAGLGAVAEAIRGIEARRRTQVAVPLVRNKTDTAFELDSEDPLPDELVEYIKERVGGALRTALESGGNNGFDETCPEAVAVRSALQSTNPSAVAGLLNDASLMFQTNLGDLYPKDGALIRLQAAAFSGAEEICETDELARKRCLRAAQLYLRENLEPIDPMELEEFTDIVAEKAEGEAAEIIRADGHAIASGRRVGRFVRARYANYTTTIVAWIDKTRKGSARVEWLWKMAKKLLDVFQDPPDGPPPM